MKFRRFFGLTGIGTAILAVFLAGCNGRNASTKIFSITVESKKKDIQLYSNIKIGIKWLGLSGV